MLPSLEKLSNQKAVTVASLARRSG
ncbi:hypothetical protein AFLA70_214g002052 [Aspergillus flavus AF70]|nr:hypothetical protein AFLA70_214g002052 [Aspergillus flavus AF70]